MARWRDSHIRQGGDVEQHRQGQPASIPSLDGADDLLDVRQARENEQDRQQQYNRKDELAHRGGLGRQLGKAVRPVDGVGLRRGFGATDQAGEHFARADLEELGDPGGHHRPDGLRPTHS